MNNINDVIAGCSGCQMCSSVCPHNAISINLNDDGFYLPSVDENICTGCGICKKVCVKYDDVVVKDENRGVYAFKLADKKVLKSVSSGGAAYALAQIASANGYLIAGTAYDCKSNRAVMGIDSNPLTFSGSKYIQTYVGDVYKQILNDGRKYIVFGTPCQIYALDRVTKLKNIRDNFILTDFFCHGCPSMLLWDKYIDWCAKKITPEKIQKVEFRSKARAWHEFCVSVNGIPQKDSAYFYDLFFSDKLLNKKCYDCKLRSTLNYADIRIGDFWGDCYDSDSEGVSALIAVSERGKKLVGKIPKETIIAEHQADDVIKFQSFGAMYKQDSLLRSVLLDSLRSDSNIKESFKLYCGSLSKKAKIKRISKKIILLMPFSVRAFFRKKKHRM